MTEPTKKPRVRRTKAQIEADRLAAQKPKRVRRTRAQIEADNAKAAAQPPVKPKEKFDKTFHFLTDGVTAFGKVWYRGEEVRIVEGSREYGLAFNKLGDFIFNLTPMEQYVQWGEIRYAEGPWPYGGYETEGLVDEETGKPIELTESEKAALAKANKARHLEG